MFMFVCLTVVKNRVTDRPAVVDQRDQNDCFCQWSLVALNREKEKVKQKDLTLKKRSLSVVILSITLSDTYKNSLSLSLAKTGTFSGITLRVRSSTSHLPAAAAFTQFTSFKNCCPR